MLKSALSPWERESYVFAIKVHKDFQNRVRSRETRMNSLSQRIHFCASKTWRISIANSRNMTDMGGC